MPQLNNPDDKLFKAVFQRPDLVKEVLQQIADADLLKKLDLDSLQLTNASYVDEELSEHLADIVHTCQTSSHQKVEISLILEHKSYVPPHPPFQVMRYQMKGWTLQKADSKLKKTPILPVIFYHGKEEWKIRSWGSYLEGMEPEFEKYTPAGNYIFIDLSKMADEEIYRFRSGFLITALLLMKHRLEREYLLNNLKRIVIFVEQESETKGRDLTDDLVIIYRYLQSLRSIKWNEVKQQVQSLPKSKNAMTIVEEIKMEMKEEAKEELREEVRQEVMQELRQEVRQEVRQETETLLIQSLIEHFPDYTDKQISKVSNLPLELVSKVRAQVKVEPGKSKASKTKAKTKSSPRKKKS